MGYRDYKVLHTDINDNTTELDYIVDIRLTLQKDAKNNALEITLGNYDEKYVNGGETIFNDGEKLQIFAIEGYVDITNIDALLGTYDIKNINLTPDNRTIKLVAVDATYKMLSTLYSRVNTIEEGQTAKDIIYNAVQSGNYDGVNQNGTTVVMDTTKSDGTPFPVIGYTSVWKTTYEAIGELSQIGETGDNLPYLFWFDVEGTFHWTYPGATAKPIPFKNLTENVISMSMKKTNSSVVNMLIFDAGEDKNGDSILDFEYNTNTKSLDGAVKFQPMVEIAKEYKKELGANYATISNSDFIDECVRRGKNKATAILFGYSHGVWEAYVTTYGAKYNPGDLYTVEAVDSGFAQMNLRVQTVVHSINANGWVTKLTLQEDPTKMVY